MAPTIAPKISPTLRTGVGSTAGARDGSPAVEGGLAEAKRQKMAEGKIPRVFSNLDGVRHRVNPPRLATAKAAADTKGTEVIPSDEDDEPVKEATLTRMAKPRKVGRTTPVDKTTSIGKTASGKAAKLRIGVASNAARDVAMGEMPTGAPLTMDNDDEYVNNEKVAGMARPRSMAVTTVGATALVNDSIVGGQVGASVHHDRASGDPGGIGGTVQVRDEPNDLAPALPNGRTHRVPSTVGREAWRPRDSTALPRGIPRQQRGMRRRTTMTSPRRFPMA
jgi:hypothetical protein